MNNILSLRKAAGVSQAELGKAIGVAQNTVSAWEKGSRQPDNECLRLLAEYFDVSVDEILGYNKTNIRPANLSNSVVTINVYGQIPAGIPVEAIEDIIGTEQIPAEWGAGGREFFALQVKGDSMYPVYLDGDIVIVRKQNTCLTGDDCVVYVNGYDATLKRVKLHDDGSIEIIPLNVNYPPRTFTREEAENMPITIGGVVVELRRKIK
jgi:repressor LexA